MDTKTRWVAGVVGVALACAGIWWASNQQAINAKRGYVVSQLRDPDSVQFRAERLTGDGWLCGEMNSKNAYGAYTGFNRFMSLGEEDAWIDGSGYAGKKRDLLGGSKLVRESLQAQIEVLSERNKLMKAGAAAMEPLSEDELSEKANSHLFSQKWGKHCT